jgi:hypothetical protein
MTIRERTRIDTANRLNTFTEPVKITNGSTRDGSPRPRQDLLDAITIGDSPAPSPDPVLDQIVSDPEKTGKPVSPPPPPPGGNPAFSPPVSMVQTGGAPMMQQRQNRQPSQARGGNLRLAGLKLAGSGKPKYNLTMKWDF